MVSNTGGMERNEQSDVKWLTPDKPQSNSLVGEDTVSCYDGR